jgi:hypothetical protein
MVYPPLPTTQYWIPIFPIILTALKIGRLTASGYIWNNEDVIEYLRER